MEEDVMNPKELNCCSSVMISNMKRSRASEYQRHCSRGHLQKPGHQ